MSHLICSPPVRNGSGGMGRISMATRDELVVRILDEFVAVTGLHRKRSMRLLRGGQAFGAVACYHHSRQRGRGQHGNLKDEPCLEPWPAFVPTDLNLEVVIE